MEMTDIDTNEVDNKEISTNTLTSEENKKVLQRGIELTSHQLVHDEKSLKEECETTRLDERSFKENRESRSSEKLEDETIVVTEILTNSQNKCDELNPSMISNANKIEIAFNNCDVSANIQNITQLTSKENETHKCHTAVDENTSDIRQETLQRSVEIIECNISNNTNIVQNKYANDRVINQDVEISINKIDNPSQHKQGRYKCILVY